MKSIELFYRPEHFSRRCDGFFYYELIEHAPEDINTIQELHNYIEKMSILYTGKNIFDENVEKIFIKEQIKDKMDQYYRSISRGPINAIFWRGHIKTMEELLKNPSQIKNYKKTDFFYFKEFSKDYIDKPIDFLEIAKKIVEDEIPF